MKDRDCIHTGIVCAVVFSLASMVMSTCSLVRSNGRMLGVDYLGVIVGILAAIITLLVGWQIYNVIEIRSIVKEYNDLKSKLSEAQTSLEAQDVRNLSLIEAYAKLSEVQSYDLNFASQYKILLDALELFIKANVPLDYHPINEIIRRIEEITKYQKYWKFEEKQSFVSHESLFEKSYQKIIKLLFLRKDEIENLFATISELREKRKELCKNIITQN